MRVQNLNEQGEAGAKVTGSGEDRLGGLGRVLIVCYIILALAATFRSVYQMISKFDEAPVAYSLSAVSGIIYIVAAVALINRKHRVWRGIAWAALSFELIGVLVVGLLSIIEPQWFAHPSVWSYFGQGYVFIPLVLPVLGLLWLRRDARSRAEREAQGKATTAGEPNAGL